MPADDDQVDGDFLATQDLRTWSPTGTLLKSYTHVPIYTTIDPSETLRFPKLLFGVRISSRFALFSSLAGKR
jgi:hypothetical protein